MIKVEVRWESFLRKRKTVATTVNSLEENLNVVSVGLVTRL